LSTCSTCTPAGLPVRRMPQRPSQSMSTGGRAGGAVGRSPGGITRSTLGSWPTPAPRGGRGGDGPPRRPHHRERRGSASRSRPRPTLRRTMAGPGWPPRAVLRSVQRPRCFKRIRSNTPAWNRAVAGSRPPRRSPPCGGSNPNGLPPGRCSPKRATTSFTLVGTSADFTLSVLIRRV